MNNKGYTLVELLAVIVILGILSGVAVMGVSRYLSQSKQQAYDTLAQSSAVAFENYIIKQGDKASAVLSELVDEGYLEGRTDPEDKARFCDGVIIKEDNSGVGLSSNNYTVYLSCSAYTAKYKFPDESKWEIAKDEIPWPPNYIPGYGRYRQVTDREEKLLIYRPTANTSNYYVGTDYTFDDNTGMYKLSGTLNIIGDNKLGIIPYKNVYTFFQKSSAYQSNKIYYVTNYSSRSQSTNFYGNLYSSKKS